MPKYRKVEKINYWKGMTFSQKVDYFFQYYFWKTVIAAVAVVLVVMGIVQILNNKKPDVELMFVSDVYLNDTEQAKISAAFEIYVDDNNGDGAKTLGFTPIVFMNGSGIDMTRYNLNLHEKMIILLSTGEPRILICPQEELESLIEGGLQVALSSTVGKSALSKLDGFSKVPEEYALVMVEMGQNIKKTDANVSKRDYTESVFKSITIE